MKSQRGKVANCSRNGATYAKLLSTIWLVLDVSGSGGNTRTPNTIDTFIALSVDIQNGIRRMAYICVQ